MVGARTLCTLFLLSWLPIAQADPPPAPEDGGPLHWQVTGVSSGLNLHDRPSTDGTVIERLPPGAVLANLGCLSAEGRTWCDVQPFRGGPRGFVSAEFLTPAISPNGAAIMGPDNSALRAGQGDFDANGSIPCSTDGRAPREECPFAVARHGGGYATVVITRPDGRTRAIYFVLGVAIGADTSEADGYHDFSVEKIDDVHHVRVGPERYEIFEAVVLGG